MLQCMPALWTGLNYTFEGEDVEATIVVCMAVAAVFIMPSNIGSVINCKQPALGQNGADNSTQYVCSSCDGLIFLLLLLIMCVVGMCCRMRTAGCAAGRSGTGDPGVWPALSPCAA